MRLLEWLACLAGDEGHDERGLTLAAAAAVLRERVGAPASAPARAELEHIVLFMQGRLGEEAARRAWQAGTAMSMSEAVALATSAGDGQ